MKKDPEELNNIADKSTMKGILDMLQQQLFDWQLNTNDPWICSPHAVLEDKGSYKNNPQCLDLYNIQQ